MQHYAKKDHSTKLIAAKPSRSQLRPKSFKGTEL